MYKRLLIAVDEDAVSRAAVVEGLTLARVLGAEVLFFHVLPTYQVPLSGADVMPLAPLDVRAHERYVHERAGRVLAEAAALAKSHDVPSRGVLGHGDDPAACVAQAAQEHHCDMLVVGSHGRTALQRLVLGSMAASLLPLAPMPMLVCKVREHA